MPAPDELVGWFQHHPYLKTSKPEPVTVGGVKGVQFDVDVVNLQKGDASIRQLPEHLRAQHRGAFGGLWLWK